MSYKIGVIGAGDIGFTVAEILAIRGYDVVIYNRYHQSDDGEPSPQWLAKMGKLMDVTDGLELPNFGRVCLTSNLADLDNALVTVITAGAKRQSMSETREELAKKNAKIIEGFTEYSVRNPNTTILIISNPVDCLTLHLINQVSKNSKTSPHETSKRIIGVSLVDTMRLKNIIKNYLTQNNIIQKIDSVEAYAIGEHGPTMVPVMSAVKVNNIYFSDMVSKTVLDEISKNTILRGNDIIKLTGASSVSGPAYAAMYMVRELCETSSTILPASVYDGQRAIGQLALFKSLQVDSVLTLDLNHEEAQNFQKSKEALDLQYNTISHF